MTKTKKETKAQKEVKQSFLAKFNFNEILPPKYHAVVMILVMFILFLIFLNPLYFGGKTFQSGDIIASESAKPYILKDREGFSLWNPHIFCGMPAYALGTEKTWFNLIYMGFGYIRTAFSSLFSVDYAMWSFYLIMLGISSFLLMRHISKNTLVSLFTAIATAFSTGIIVFLYIGHVTKLTSLCMYPLIFLILLKFEEKIKIVYALTLIIVLQLFIQGFHVQIIFYTLFAVAIYYTFFFVRSLINKQKEISGRLIKSAGVFAVASILAVLISADNLTQIYEYTPFSTRGGKSITETATGKAEQSESQYYDYHTSWSFSPEEVMTFIIPSFYGFGNSTYKGPLTQNQEYEVNTYFGQMPFVDVAMYMGVLVFFLALFAIVTCWKEPFVQFLTILSGIALFISFGKNLSLLFDLMFYYFPYFDKFRVPSMILVLVQMSLPVLAGYGIMKIISLREHTDKKAFSVLKYSAYIFAGIFVLSLIGNSALSSWFTGRVNDHAASLQTSNPQYAQYFQAFAEYMAKMFTNDFILAFGMLTVVFWSGVFFVNRKLSADAVVLVIIILTLIDLWRIDARGAKYHDNPEIKNQFETPEYVKAIKSQNDKEPFRILNLKQDRSLGSFAQNSNFNAYFLLEDFYGYSGIKPRTYQDIIEVVGPANPTLWKMLGVKYVVSEQPIQSEEFSTVYSGEKTFVNKNLNALPRAYFIDRVEQKSNFEALNLIKANLFDPKEVAFVNEKLVVEKPDSTAYSKILKYTDENLKLDVNASGNNFMFFGSTFFSGEADYKLFKIPTGWKALIDGNETKIYQTNHGFMGIIVPKGKHTVEFVFAPKSFYVSKYVVFLLSSISLIGIAAGIFVERKRKVQTA
ncbi:MAG: YfhO family protein [Ignavibacteriaceae bacterium]|nr:YfhO family protein [Ignavibacteriaceae bacterium]